MKTILLIEDNDAFAEAATKVLDCYNIERASTLAEAESKIKKDYDFWVPLLL